MRVRKVITRSGRGLRGKFPSKKIRAMVHWECPLERHAIMLFEMHPLVCSYQEQPSEEIYYDAEGIARSCYPDFLLRLVHGGEILVEIKRGVDLKRQSVTNKLELISLRFAEQERPYRILSEEQILREPLRSNLQELWEAQRATSISPEIDASLASLCYTKRFTLKELTAIIGSQQLVLVAIATGRLRTDLEQPLAMESLVWSSKNVEAGDGAYKL